MPEAVAYLIVYGDAKDHRCVVLDHARADQNAANCHGLLVRLIVHPDDIDLLRLAQSQGLRSGAVSNF